MSRVRPPSFASLRRAVARARLEGADTPRAKRLLDVYLDAAEQNGQTAEAAARDLVSGLPALRIGGAELQAQAAAPPIAAACAPGCAFCCILAGEDGAVIFEAEARALHAALTPLAGKPDGRNWHPRACAALDPATRLCRAYDARPTICRTYLSPDAEACRDISEGLPASGPVTLGARRLTLTVQILARAALGRSGAAPTYALAEIAAAAVEGRDMSSALRTARHKPRTLLDERDRLAPPG